MNYRSPALSSHTKVLDGPKKEEFLKLIQEDIDTSMGQSVVTVLGDLHTQGLVEGFMSYSYTVGNKERNLPDLLIIGNYDPMDRTLILHVLSQMMIRNGRVFSDNEVVKLEKEDFSCVDPDDSIIENITENSHVKFVKTNFIAQENYTKACTAYYGSDDYAVIQVLLGDDSGEPRFPGDPGCERPACEVPVLRAVLN